MSFNEKNLIVALTANKKLTKLIAKQLNAKVWNTCIQHFADGEVIVKSEESVRGKNVYIIQSTSKPVNENVMELLVAIDSFKRASAKSINLICPYYGYARQDRKTAGREPITAKLVAKLLQTAGLDKICTVDIHSEQIQGFFEIPFDSITALHTIFNEIKKDFGLKNTVIVSPDYGGVKRARRIATRWNLPVVILDKRRPKPNVAEIVNVLGDIKDKNCVIMDDIIDTGGTVCKACEIIKKKGAKQIIVGATHALFSQDASERFNKLMKEKIISKLYLSNSIDNVYNLKIKNLKIIDISKLLSFAIKAYCNEKGASISKLCEIPKK